MPIITSIKQQKNKNRVNVYLDNKFGFGIDLDNFVILDLKIGQELTETDIEKIIKKAEFQKILDQLLKWVTSRPHSLKEVKNYLRRKKTPEIIWEDLIAKLKYFDLIDDKKFAMWWVETRASFSPKSKRMLKEELKFKGIDKNIIEEILDKTTIEEDKIALNLLNKKKFSDERKMIGYLVRKGFSFEIAKLALKEYNKQ